MLILRRMWNVFEAEKASCSNDLIIDVKPIPKNTLHVKISVKQESLSYARTKSLRQDEEAEV